MSLSEQEAKVQEDHCPTCGYFFDSGTIAVGDETLRPGIGDFTICVNCGELLRYGEGFFVQEVEPEDLEGLDAEQRRMITKAQMFIHKRGLIPRLTKLQPRGPGKGER